MTYLHTERVLPYMRVCLGLRALSFSSWCACVVHVWWCIATTKRMQLVKRPPTTRSPADNQPMPVPLDPSPPGLQGVLPAVGQHADGRRPPERFNVQVGGCPNPPHASKGHLPTSTRCILGIGARLGLRSAAHACHSTTGPHCSIAWAQSYDGGLPNSATPSAFFRLLQSALAFWSCTARVPPLVLPQVP